MPEIRPEPRVPVDLPVRVWGMTADGHAFNQRARARNISSAGAMIGEVENDLNVGDVIGMQCDDKKARCKVVWVNTGLASKHQVGVKVLANQECPWKTHLPEEPACSTEASNTRRFARHRISFPLELWAEHAKAPIRICATDVSGSGCYIETMLPMPAGSVVRLVFYMQMEAVRISATVRTCDPGVGNGIEFTGLIPDRKERLQGYLDGVDPNLGIAKTSPGRA